MKRYDKQHKTKNLGFTLIETLGAIVILITAITATFTAVQSGISTSIQSKNEITAFYLAQEAIEYIRNIRDENSINGLNWLAGFAQLSTEPCYPGKTCNIDAVFDVIKNCSGTCPNLAQNNISTSAYYGMFSTNIPPWASSNFRREVRVSVFSADQAQINVTVTWTAGLITRTFKANEIITDWQS